MNRNKIKALSLSLVPAIGALASTGAMAQTGVDFGSVLDGLSTTTMTAGVLAAGALLAGVAFTIWGVKRLARFF